MFYLYHHSTPKILTCMWVKYASLFLLILRSVASSLHTHNHILCNNVLSYEVLDYITTNNMAEQANALFNIMKRKLAEIKFKLFL